MGSLQQAPRDGMGWDGTECLNPLQCCLAELPSWEHGWLLGLSLRGEMQPQVYLT